MLSPESKCNHRGSGRKSEYGDEGVSFCLLLSNLFVPWACYYLCDVASVFPFKAKIEMSLLQTGISRFVMMLVAVAWNVTVLAQGIPTATTSISPYDSSNHQDLPETIRAGATLADSESAGSSNSDMYTGMGVPLNQDGSAAASRFESAYTVLLTEPADNTEYLEPASITLTASAMNNEGAISKVEFYQGETLLCTVTETPYNFIWNNVSAGDYVLTAKAYDEMGASVISTPVHISVASAPAAAQLVIDSLADLGEAGSGCDRYGDSA